MFKKHAVLGVVTMLVTACTTPQGSRFEDQRTVFNNPYVPPVIDQRGIGPACEPEQLHEPACLPPNVLYPGRGRFGYLGDGTAIRLTKNDRRFLRERAEALQARVDLLEALKNGTPLPPNSPALPENQNRPMSPADTEDSRPPHGIPGQEEPRH